MKATPVYAIETITITLTRAEAEKALTHPKPVQDLLAAVLQNGKAGGEHVGAEESPVAAPLPVAGAKGKPAKSKPAKSKPSLPCPHCAQSFTAAGWRERHIRTAHPDAAAN